MKFLSFFNDLPEITFLSFFLDIYEKNREETFTKATNLHLETELANITKGGKILATCALVLNLWGGSSCGIMGGQRVIIYLYFYFVSL